ncbi:MAG: exonuclease domain-containing protein [Saprospiraceae bacterium]|nr:exonuclease domain-containing protein [Saprospiraceae bacterium]
MKKRNFAIVDIETTGGLFKRDKITEIAIVTSDGREIIGEFESLINPGRSIPPFITKITGIDDDMVAEAPYFHEVARDIVEWTENHIFVAHNVRFDYGFIRNAFGELGYPFNRRRMCTVQMAKRLLQLNSHSLESLIRHYDIPVNRRHRALDDARATAVVLHNLLKLEGSQRHINKQITRGVRESLLPEGITIDDLHKLPEDPGIYYFRDGDGEIVYIGKSKDIQKRVMSHFTKTTRKAEKFQHRIRSIDYQLTGSDLLAKIIESQEIKENWPEFNRAQRTKRYDVYIQSTINDMGYRRFDIVRGADTSNEILNAYSSPRAAKSVMQMLIREYGLCPLYCGIEIGMGPCSLYQYDRCWGACLHEESADEYNERAELAHKHINNRFHEDFVIILDGRTNEEKALVVVHNGTYHGHTFMDKNSTLVSSEEIVEHVPKSPYYPEINTMIRQYLERNNAELIKLQTADGVNPGG